MFGCCDESLDQIDKLKEQNKQLKNKLRKIKEEVSQALDLLNLKKPFKSDYDRAQWDALHYIEEVLNAKTT